jgi:hypothetical protein
MTFRKSPRSIQLLITPLMDLSRYSVGVYFLWASVTTLVSRFFLNLRAAGTSNNDWITAGIHQNWTSSGPTFSRKEQTRTIGSVPLNRSLAKGDRDDTSFEMYSRREYSIS